MIGVLTKCRAFRLSAVVLASLVASCGAFAEETESAKSKTQLLALVLDRSDLFDATRTMQIHDLDEDGFVDKKEMVKLPWRDELSTFDLDGDSRLTHSEVAIWFANRRDDLGIEKKDRDFAKKFLRGRDKNNNLQLDPEEISASNWPPRPEEFDRDGDGSITLFEISAAFAFERGYRAASGITPSDQARAVKAMNQFDSNKDRLLSMSEAESASLPLRPAEFDHDRDGALSIEDIATMIAKDRMKRGISNADRVKANFAIRRADREDPDNKIDQDEFVNARLAGSFADYDTNGDGAITQSELEMVLAKRTEATGVTPADVAAARVLLLRHDKNKNRVLEETELLENRDAGKGRLTQKDMSSADKNDDQRLSLDEIAKHLAKQKSE